MSERVSKLTNERMNTKKNENMYEQQHSHVILSYDLIAHVAPFYSTQAE